MREKLLNAWNWLWKIAGQYAKIAAFIASSSFVLYWAVGPRVVIEFNEVKESFLHERDSMLIVNVTDSVVNKVSFVFVEALKDTSFLNKIELIIQQSVEKAVDKKVDEKLTEVVRRELFWGIKQYVTDTIKVIDANTGIEIGYDIYDFYKGHIIKTKEVRY